MRYKTAWLIVTLALGTLAAHPAAGAQPPPKVARIGFIISTSPSTGGHNLEAFRQGLRDLGRVDGENIVKCLLT